MNPDLVALARVMEYLLVLLRTSKKMMPEDYKALMEKIDRITEREKECTDSCR